MNDFRLALLGDGVFHRWGLDCPHLQAEFSRLYTQSTFEIDNHGLLGSRAGNALWRITSDYEKDGVKMRHLSYYNPDLVVIDSFAYTQFWDGPEGLSEYRDLLRRIWEEINRTTTAKCLFTLGAKPIRDKFLDGARNFQNTSKAQRARFADAVTMYLNEAGQIAEDEGWPVADVAGEIDKQIAAGNSPRRYVDGHESMFPSSLGFEMAAKMIVRAADNGRMIEESVKK